MKTSFKTFATFAVCAGSLSLAACHTDGNRIAANLTPLPPPAETTNAFRGLTEGTDYVPGDSTSTDEERRGTSTNISGLRTTTLTRPTTGQANAGMTVITIDSDGSGTQASPRQYVFSDTDNIALSTDAAADFALLVANSDSLLDTKTRYGHITAAATLVSGRTATAATIATDGLAFIVTGTPTAAADLPEGSGADAVAYSGEWFIAQSGALSGVTGSDYTGAFRDNLEKGTFDLMVNFSTAGGGLTFANPTGNGMLSGGTLGVTGGANDGTFSDVTFTGTAGGDLDSVIFTDSIRGRFYGPDAADAIGTGGRDAVATNPTHILGFVANKN